ncbi:phytoene/squalene synthase family protein [Gordonia otitidis]|uniref:Phytoene synthase n=1 Tax=Gordonia otitidis (strain DSM 44809 / CCUG 52243 / JCM 12355 / NBRC 100426 / IFM 10032) TaxID=1108044 RepID=H5TTF2_GORO1|nr:squalene/phytoene synthase family protein [Gordonia otitidis]GAB36760.1 phytoene synthase [Gordonia otitidis NBRC 100426]
MSRRSRVDLHAPHDRYDEVADASAALVINSYSSSFGLASRLLGEPVRSHVRNIYALVRVADEIVDAPRPGQGTDDRHVALDRLESETNDALESGSSSNLVVHAFARSARRVGVDTSLTAPFFSSMRMDLTLQTHDEKTLAEYIYGSAEVVGLMCLRAFVADEPRADQRYDELSRGAQHLGAAFQKVNFLRDFGTDSGDLGRRYLVGLDPTQPSAVAWTRWLNEIDGDLAIAAATIRELPRSSRIAVCVAHDLFAELNARLRATPASMAARHRVRVPTATKTRIAATAVLRRGQPRASVSEGVSA